MMIVTVMLKIFTISLIISVVQGEVQIPKQDWWQAATFYQIYVRSFMDSDGDGVGDINGVTSRLEYLKELGIEAAILSPIYKSPMLDFGYDVSDYYMIQPEYGSMDDFEQLINKAKELNIKIVLEFIPNHTSNESEWFQKSASKDEYYRDWYIWENGHIGEDSQRRPPNNWISAFSKSAWTYYPQRDKYYLHQFGESQPDLNLRNPVVIEELKTIIRFWLEKGVAGMRMSSCDYLFEVDKDAYGGRYPDEPITGKLGVGPDDYDYLHHIYTKDLEETYELMSQFRETFNYITVRDNVTRILMTVANTSIKNVMHYYGDRLHAGAHVPFNFVLIDNVNKDSDARDLKYAVDRWMTYKPLKKRANWATGNHDRSRVATRFRPELVDAYNMLVLMLPGIAISYMGEEIGMTDGFVSWPKAKDPLGCQTDDPVNFIKVSRDPARTPFQWSKSKNAGFSNSNHPWLPVGENYETLNVMAQRSSVRSHYQVYRALMGLRVREAFRSGRYESMALNNNVFAFKRWSHEDCYVIILNIGSTDSIVNLTAFESVTGRLEVEVSSVSSHRSYGDSVNANYLDLASEEALVLRLHG